MSEETAELEKRKRLIFYAETFVELSGDCNTNRYLHIHKDGSVRAVLYDGENICLTRSNDVNILEGTSNIGAERVDSLAQRLYEALSEFQNLNDPDKDTNIENFGKYGNMHHVIKVTYRGQTRKIKWWDPTGETPEKIKPLEIELKEIYNEVTIK